MPNPPTLLNKKNRESMAKLHFFQHQHQHLRENLTHLHKMQKTGGWSADNPRSDLFRETTHQLQAP